MHIARLRRYYTLLFVLTFMGLYYTHQQFLLIKANYDIIKLEKQLSHLLDHNRKLIYNVTTLESPGYLEKRLTSTGLDLDVPAQWAMIEKRKTRPPYHKVAMAPQRRGIFANNILNFLAVKAEAQSQSE